MTASFEDFYKYQVCSNIIILVLKFISYSLLNKDNFRFDPINFPYFWLLTHLKTRTLVIPCRICNWRGRSITNTYIIKYQYYWNWCIQQISTALWILSGSPDHINSERFFSRFSICFGYVSSLLFYLNILKFFPKIYSSIRGIFQDKLQIFDVIWIKTSKCEKSLK